MELRKGYKQTEVGEIPKEWEVQELDNLSNRGSGHTPNKRFSQYYNGNIVWVSLADSSLLDNGLISTSAINISGLGLKHSSAVLHPKGSVLLSRDAGIGKSAIAGCDLCVSQHFIVWTCKENILNNWFLYYWLQYNKSEFERIAIGSTIKTIGLPYFKKYRIPLPTYKEQTAIAAALIDMDELIKSLSVLMKKKKAMKLGAMKKLLKPNDGWVVKKLGEIAEIYQPQTISQNLFTNDGYLVYGANGIVGFYNKYNHNTWQTIVTCRGSTCGTVNKTIGKCWITGNAMVMNVDNNSLIDKLFFYYLLLMQDFNNCITGSGQPQIVRAPLYEFEISFPNKKTQKEIATILTDIDKDIASLEIKISKYKMIKQGMMQNLLTGKIRLV